MNGEFSKAMSKSSDQELANILVMEREKYQKEAVFAAKAEFDKRNLDIYDFFSEDEIIKEEERKKPAAYYERNALRRKKEAAELDILYGAYCCAGGVIAYVLGIGNVHWGAFVIGALYFIKGMNNS